MFQQLFEHIDTYEVEFGVQSYGMSVTTLEEVYTNPNPNPKPSLVACKIYPIFHPLLTVTLTLTLSLSLSLTLSLTLTLTLTLRFLSRLRRVLIRMLRQRKADY
jgi:hypothetical protein